MQMRTVDHASASLRVRVLHLLLAAFSSSAVALTGCSTVVQTITFNLTKTVATPIDGSAALAYLEQPVIQAGSPSTSVIIHGAGFLPASQMLFDGTAHAATYSSGAEMQFSLSAKELAVAGRHNVQVQNPGTGVANSNSVALLVTPGYTALGDSITAGAALDIPLTEAYPYLVAAQLSLGVTDYAVSGDQACDIFPHAIYRQAIGYATATAPLYSIMIGTNDADHYGAGSYEAVYNHCHQAALAWLGTSRVDKLLPGDAALTVSGGCSSPPDSQNLGAMTCAGGATGTITASSFRTTGRPIYVWYTFSGDAPASAAFSVAVDGATPVSARARSEVPIGTYNGTTQSVAVLRIPAAAGNHDVIIQTAGGIGIQGIGTNRGGSSIPQVVIGDIPQQLQGNPNAAVSTQLRYSADIQANVAQALSDGLDVRLAQDRLTMWGTRPEMYDSVHPTALGHQHLVPAFLAALQ